MVSTDPFSPALEEAYERIKKLLAERSQIEKRRAKIDNEILNLKRVIDGLLAVYESENESENEQDPSDVEISATTPSGRATLKFTDAVRMVLRQNASKEIPLSVPEIREQLINLGFNFAKYAQPLVPIHNTLKRLFEQGEVEPIRNDGQIIGYRWISSLERALNEPPSYAEALGPPYEIGQLNSLAEYVKQHVGDTSTLGVVRERFKEAARSKARKNLTVQVHKVKKEGVSE